MARAGRSEESAKKQIESSRAIAMPASLRDRLDEFAEANQMSRSAAIEVLERYVVSGKLPDKPVRQTERVMIWVSDPDLYADFATKVKEKGWTRASALEIALDAVG